MTKFNPKQFIKVTSTTEKTTVEMLIGGDYVTVGYIDRFYDMYAMELRNLLAEAEIIVNKRYTRVYNMSHAVLDHFSKTMTFFINENEFPKQINIISSYTGHVVAFEPVEIDRDLIDQTDAITYAPNNEFATKWKVILKK